MWYFSAGQKGAVKLVKKIQELFTSFGSINTFYFLFYYFS